MYTRKETRIKFNKSSVFQHPCKTEKQTIQSILSDWILYEEMTRAQRSALVTTCTSVSSVSIVLFAGPSKLPQENVRNSENRNGKLYCSSIHSFGYTLLGAGRQYIFLLLLTVLLCILISSCFYASTMVY